VIGHRTLVGVTVALAVAVLVAGAGVLLAVYERSRIRTVDLTKPVRPGETGGAVREAPKGAPINILMVGSDSRAFAQTSQDRKQFGAKQQGDSQRSDTMMIVRLDPRTDHATILSIARDLYVKIEGGGTDRINGAFADPKDPTKSDPDRLIRTITSNFGIPINHYIEVDFAGFRDVVNAIGGVSVYFKYPSRDAFSLLDARQPGCLQLDGDKALSYVRARHLEVRTAKGWEFDGTGDIGRIQRQQDFMRRVLHKAIRDGLTNPVTAYKLIDAGAGNVTTDSGFGVNDMRNLANQLRGISDSGLSTLALAGNPFTTPDGADVLKVDPAASGPVLAAFGGTDPASAATSAHPPARLAPPPTAAQPTPIVKVLNGTGQNGAATGAVTALQALHLTVSNGGNAPLKATTQIRSRPGDEAAAKIVQADLGGDFTTTADQSVQPGHIVLVLGRSFAGITKPTPGPAEVSGPLTPPPSSGVSPPTTLPPKGSDPSVSC